MIWAGRAGAPGGAAGRAGTPAGPGFFCRTGREFLQDWERILSFFGYFGTDYI